MTGKELFDRFYGGEVGVVDVSQMSLHTVLTQIKYMRQDAPGDIPLTDREIALAIKTYVIDKL